MKLLLIEDEKLTRISLASTLKKAGHEVIACETGIDGLNKFKNGRFEVVITDLRLPRISGFDVLREIKKREKNCDILIITAYGSIETEKQALKMGAYDYLKKPFSPDELLSVLLKLKEIRQNR